MDSSRDPAAVHSPASRAGVWQNAEALPLVACPQTLDHSHPFRRLLESLPSVTAEFLFGLFGHGPEVHASPANVDLLVRFPINHVELVRHDASPDLQLPE